MTHEVHVCKNTAVRVIIRTEHGPYQSWYSFHVPSWEEILEDTGLSVEDIGIDTLDKFKQTFPEHYSSLDHLKSFEYSGFSVKLFCEEI